MLRDQQGVVPVSADLAGGAGRNIGSGSLERLQVLGKPQQQEPLELLGVEAGLLMQAGVVDGHGRGAGQRDDQDFVVGIKGPVV